VGVTGELKYAHKWTEMYTADKMRKYQLLRKDCAACSRLKLVGTVTTSTQGIAGMLIAVRP
jgi:hypothetical protein